MIMKKHLLNNYLHPDVKVLKLLSSSQLCDSSPESEIDGYTEGSVRGVPGATYFD